MQRQSGLLILTLVNNIPSLFQGIVDILTALYKVFLTQHNQKERAWASFPFSFSFSFSFSTQKQREEEEQQQRIKQYHIPGGYIKRMAMPSFSILRCFSEQSDRRRYVCEGDVCYLRGSKASKSSDNSKKNDQKQSIRIPFYRVSTKSKAWDLRPS